MIHHKESTLSGTPYDKFAEERAARMDTKMRYKLFENLSPGGYIHFQLVIRIVVGSRLVAVAGDLIKQLLT